MAKGSSFDPEDRQAIKQALKEKFKAKILLSGNQFFANLRYLCGTSVELDDEHWFLQLLNNVVGSWMYHYLKIVNKPKPQLACPIKFSRSQIYQYTDRDLGEGKW